MILLEHITFEQIRAFQAVSREKNFSRAAERVGRTQAAVSIQINRLEKLIGKKLFSRTTKSVEFTDAGLILHAYCTELEQLLSQAENELADLSRNATGELVLSASDTTACYYLPGIIRKYKELYTGVSIVVENSTSPRTVRKVMEGTVELGIVTLEDVPAELETIQLFPRNDVIICHPDHPLAARKSVFLKDLEHYGAILLDRNCATRKLLDRLCDRTGTRLQIIMELSSVEVIKRFISINSGISVVPETAITAESSAGTIRTLQLRDSEKEEEIWMGIVYRKNHYLSFAARSFIDLADKTG